MVKSLSQVELNTVCVEMIGFESTKVRVLVSKCNVSLHGLGFDGSMFLVVVQQLATKLGVH